MKLKIDPEFKALIPPLSSAERAGLRATLQEAGRARDPIIVWREGRSRTPTIIDGHNRYELCTELGLSFRTETIALPDRAAVRAWMLNHQRARRNLTNDQRCILEAKLDAVGPPGTRTASQIKALELLERSPEGAEKVLRGESTLTAAWNDAFPERRRPHQPRVTNVTVIGGPATVPTTVAPPDAAERVELARAKAKASEATAASRDLVEALKESQDALEAMTALAAAPLPPVQRRELGRGTREATALVLCSDLHLEEMVKPEDTPAGNAYNLAIAELRLRRMFDSTMWQCEHARQGSYVRNLVLWLGGDIITNHLHEENVERCQLGPTEAILWAQDRIAAGIRALVERGGFEQIDVVCSYGNHGRFTHKPRATTGAAHSLEFLMYCNLAHQLAPFPQVKVHATKAEHQYHRIYDLDAHFHHGHRVQYGGGVGGIMIPINKATSQWDRWRECDLHFYGHWHQYLDAGKVTINGSLIGASGYAMAVKATPEPPAQAFLLIDSKRGKCLTAPLWVGDPSAEAALWKEAA